MHELSVALSLIDALTESLGTHPDVRIEVIHLKIGPLSGVIEPALRSAFEIAAVGTIAEGAILAIQVPPIVLRCEECGQETNLCRCHGQSRWPRLLDKLATTCLPSVRRSSPDGRRRPGARAGRCGGASWMNA